MCSLSLFLCCLSKELLHQSAYNVEETPLKTSAALDVVFLFLFQCVCVWYTYVYMSVHVCIGASVYLCRTGDIGRNLLWLFIIHWGRIPQSNPELASIGNLLWDLLSLPWRLDYRRATTRLSMHVVSGICAFLCLKHFNCCAVSLSSTSSAFKTICWAFLSCRIG